MADPVVKVVWAITRSLAGVILFFIDELHAWACRVTFAELIADFNGSESVGIREALGFPKKQTGFGEPCSTDCATALEEGDPRE